MVVDLRILLVEDEQRLADALEYILKKNNFMVDVAFNGVEGQDMAETGIYDLIVLDRRLPGKEGVDILKYIRKKGIKSAVIFLTAKDSVENRVEGLDAGADDYLVKPFSTKEFLARVRALARRSENNIKDKKIKIASLYFDSLRCEVAYGSEIIKLTFKETQLLELLIRNKGKVLTKEQILERVWGFNSDVEMNNIELYIYYLRKKIDFPKLGINIDTIRGVGYCMKEL